MSSHLHNRISKLERTMMAGKVRETERDPELVSFLEKYGITPKECPSGITAKDWLENACKNARIFGVVKREEESAEIGRRLVRYAR
jgi:hypothetical protein